MDQRVSVVSLVVRDLATTRTFYVDGLGWHPEVDVADEVVMIRVAEKVVLSLWAEPSAVEEIGPIARGGEGSPPVTLAHNCATPAEVDVVLTEAAAAGAAVSAAVTRSWGGYSGYFTDPDGFRWEVAHNPGELGASLLP